MLNDIGEIWLVNVIYWIGIKQNLTLLEQSRRGDMELLTDFVETDIIQADIT